MHTRGWRLGALFGVLALAMMASTVVAANAVDYPTWEEVEAARNNEAATAATVANISIRTR